MDIEKYATAALAAVVALYALTSVLAAVLPAGSRLQVVCARVALDLRAFAARKEPESKKAGDK